MKEPTTCRCCGGGPLVGYQALCEACALAVDRFLTLRRRNLSPEYQAQVTEWRARNSA